MRFSEWRGRAPMKDSVGPKVIPVVEAALVTLGAERDPECWVAWGDDPAVRYLILAPTPSGLVQLNVRVNVPGEGPRAGGKIVRWARVQLGELGVEIQGGHRLVTFQVDTLVLNGVDEAADRVAAFAQALFAAVDGRSTGPAAGSKRSAPAAAGSGQDRQAHRQDRGKPGARGPGARERPEWTRLVRGHATRGDDRGPVRPARSTDQSLATDDPLLDLPLPGRRPHAGLPQGPSRRPRAPAAGTGRLLLQPHELGRPVRADGRAAVPAAPVVLRTEGGGPARRGPEPGDVLDRLGDPVQAGQERPARGDPTHGRGHRLRRRRRDRRRGPDPRPRMRAPALERGCRLLRDALGRPAHPGGDPRARAGCASAVTSRSGWGRRSPPRAARTARRSPR